VQLALREPPDHLDQMVTLVELEVLVCKVELEPAVQLDLPD
jgi:hypothetical protein